MEEYGFTCEGIHPQQVKVPKVINLEEISKVFGQAINKNGYSYVHSNNLKFIKKNLLWMVIHQKPCLLSSRLISLGMARILVCEKMGTMNWAMYDEWTNWK